MSFNSPTFRLFRTKPSFLSGTAALLDLSKLETKFFYNKTESEADCASIEADWYAIGYDMKQAIAEYDKQRK